MKRSNPSGLACGSQFLILLAVIAAGIAPNPVVAQQSNDDATWLASEKPVPSAPVIIDGHVRYRV